MGANAFTSSGEEANTGILYMAVLFGNFHRDTMNEKYTLQSTVSLFKNICTTVLTFALSLHRYAACA